MIQTSLLQLMRDSSSVLDDLTIVTLSFAQRTPEFLSEAQKSCIPEDLTHVRKAQNGLRF